MKGYLYISGRGADPGLHNNLNDPLFGPVPTLGACMPNIRDAVEQGDFIFVVSGKTNGVQQYVVGGMQVEDKISALAAYGRFPENRIRTSERGELVGNIIVNADGTRSNLDEHSADSFERRIQNYIVGTNPIALTEPEEIDRGRSETLERLSQVLNRPRANRVIDIMGRWRRLEEPQIQNMVEWLQGIKETVD